MRRFSILISAMVLVLLGLSGSWGGGIKAQDASPEATPGSIPALPAQWAEAWSSHDAEQVVALYTPDAVYEEVPTNSVSQGHDDIRAFVQGTYDTFSDIEVTPRRGFQAENWAVLEGDFAGRSADGVPFTVPFIVVMELDGQMIRRSADYFDLNSVLSQIAAGPATEATPAA
jgi:steroid delta-isomerase-like uncharacterized protein